MHFAVACYYVFSLLGTYSIKKEGKWESAIGDFTIGSVS